MNYNELKTAVNLLNEECSAGVKVVAVKHEVLETDFKEASVYFAGEAEKNGELLSEGLQAFYRDLTGDELHNVPSNKLPAAAIPGPTPGPVPAAPAAAPATRTVTASTPPSAVAANVPVPEGAARRRYPFAEMDVNHSFFVPATDDRPDPAKSMQSTVSSAIRKFSVPDPSGETRVNRNGETVPVMNPTRSFICRPVEDGKPWGFPGIAGAGIWRTP